VRLFIAMVVISVTTTIVVTMLAITAEIILFDSFIGFIIREDQSTRQEQRISHECHFEADKLLKFLALGLLLR
jgi:hypothetical protein